MTDVPCAAISGKTPAGTRHLLFRLLPSSKNTGSFAWCKTGSKQSL
jgi:hypothetical protein